MNMRGIVLFLELLLMLVAKMVTYFKTLFLHFASFVVGGKDKPMDEAQKVLGGSISAKH